MSILKYLQNSENKEGHICLGFFFFFFSSYLWLCWVFAAVRGLSLVAVSGGYSSLLCLGFSLWWVLLLLSTGSRYADFKSCNMQALESRLQ